MGPERKRMAGTGLRHRVRVRPWQSLAAQWRDLDRRDPSSWPALPRGLLLLLVVALVPGLLWAAWLRPLEGELQTARQRERALRADYQARLRQAAGLRQLRQQRAEVLRQVERLERQLPSQAEIDALLSDINQAGLGRGLQFELFRPGPVVVRAHYAEMPIALKISGRYHALGAFAADLAGLPRIVTLDELVVTPGPDQGRPDWLQLTATARTFRYLDADEAARRQAAAPAGAKP